MGMSQRRCAGCRKLRRFEEGAPRNKPGRAYWSYSETLGSVVCPQCAAPNVTPAPKLTLPPEFFRTAGYLRAKLELEETHATTSAERIASLQKVGNIEMAGMVQAVAAAYLLELEKSSDLKAQELLCLLLDAGLPEVPRGIAFAKEIAKLPEVTKGKEVSKAIGKLLEGWK